MSPFMLLLDQIGIVLGLILGVVEIGQWIILWRMSNDLEDIEEELDDKAP